MLFIAEFIESIMPLLRIISVIFWIWMLVDCSKRAKVRPYRGFLFILIFFTNWVGALIYFLIFVSPLNKVFRSATQWSQPAQQRPFIHYTPPKPPAYRDYQQGYQPQSVPTPSAPTPTLHTQEVQSPHLASDYEEPQSAYPEIPPQQQQ